MKTKLFENINGNQFKLSEDGDETDMNKPEEKREVQIGKEIERLVRAINVPDKTVENDNLNKILELAIELVKMHSKQ
jgi:hypothetical protein